MKKRILAVLLIAVMILGTIGGVALADKSGKGSAAEHRNSGNGSQSDQSVLSGTDTDAEHLEYQTGVGSENENDENENDDDDENGNAFRNQGQGDLLVFAPVVSFTTNSVTLQGITVVTDSKTKIMGTLAVGAFVQVQADLINGQWLAKQVKVKTGENVPTTVVPAAPTGLNAAAASSNQVNLGWNDNSNNETGFRVQRATDAGFTAGVTTVTVGAGVNVYVDTTPAPATAYFYRVLAYNSIGDSAPSNVATVTTPALATTAPAAASNLVAVAASSTRVNLTWTDNSTNETGFRVQRATDVGFTAGVTTVNVLAGVTSYADTTVVANTAYFYRVAAFNAIGDAPYSNTATVTTPAVPVIDAAAVFAATCSSCHGANHPQTKRTDAQLLNFIPHHNTGSTLTADQVAALATWIKSTTP